MLDISRLLLFLILTPPASSYVRTDVSTNRTNHFDGDIIGFASDAVDYDDGASNGDIQSAAVRYNLRHWPNGVVPYFINFTQTWKRKNITNAMRTIQTKTCIRFVEKTDETDYVSIGDYYDNKCCSYIGRMGNMQILSLNDDCLMLKDTILHELMHTLGFVHEQSRYDRDDYIIIHWDRIPGKENNWDFHKYNRSAITHQHTNYDYKSVMHYQPIQNGIVVMSPVRVGAVIESNGLSWTDIKEINDLYHCDISYDDVTVIRKCKAHVFYCGRELTRMNYNNVYSDDSLYECQSNGSAYYHTDCYRNCQESRRSSFCSCTPRKIYCGYELRKMNIYKPGLQDHYLYFCNDQSQPEIRVLCNSSCYSDKPKSYCNSTAPNPCISNGKYCGYALQILGLIKADTNSLYRCADDVDQSQLLEFCSSACIINSTHDHYCDSGKIASPMEEIFV